MVGKGRGATIPRASLRLGELFARKAPVIAIGREDLVRARTKEERIIVIAGVWIRDEPAY
jgi:hypothetical protein